MSIAGGSAHNIGQILVAALVLDSVDLFFYAPVLLIAGEVTGLLIGIAAGEVLKRIGRGEFS